MEEKTVKGKIVKEELVEGKTSGERHGKKDVVREKTVKDSLVETIHIVRPADLNSANRLYGGVLMAWIDEVAALVAKRHTQMNVTTASVDNLTFLRGAFMKDVVVIRGKITYVGKTSMEVKVETYVEHLNGEHDLVNRAFLTLVGLDNEGRPAKIPGLVIETPEECEEWEAAKLRRAGRIEAVKLTAERIKVCRCSEKPASQ